VETRTKEDALEAANIQIQALHKEIKQLNNKLIETSQEKDKQLKTQLEIKDKLLKRELDQINYNYTELLNRYQQLFEEREWLWRTLQRYETDLRELQATRSVRITRLLGRLLGR
jgi:predicted  nucleic acid-binding Zn-ribbon protein